MTYDVERVVIGGGVSHAGATFAAPDPARARALRAASRWPASCCRPTSSRSCRPRPRPAPGAPWPSPARPARAADRPGHGGRRWSVTREPYPPTPSPRRQTTTRATQRGEQEMKTQANHRPDALVGRWPSAPAARDRVTVAERAGIAAPHRDCRRPASRRRPRRPRVGRRPPPTAARRRIRPKRSSRASRRAPRSALDVLPVADLRPVHQGHDRPLRGDLSGRQGQVGRPPGDVPGRPQERVRRRQRAGRHQPVGQRGLGLRLRARTCSWASTTRSRRRSRTSTSRASGTASWSTARTSSSRGTRASASSSSTSDLRGRRRPSVADFPKTVDGLPALCETIQDKTGTCAPSA